MVISVWDGESRVVVSDQVINKWFSERLGFQVRLVYQRDQDIRKIDPKYSLNSLDKVSLADGYPILILSEESVKEVSERVGQTIPFLRFRPNIVIKNVDSFFEDSMADFSINGLEFKGVKPCARCIMVNVDYTDISQSTDEPLRTLAKFRKENNKVLVGMNLIPVSSGMISVNDTCVIN